jgi:two-component system sensor histidine kinase KdpD
MATSGPRIPLSARAPASETALFRSYLAGAAWVALAVLAGLAIGHIAAVPNVSLVFVVPILWMAISKGLGPALFAALLATLAYNYFFLPPVYSFTIADPANVVGLALFSVVAIVAANLAAFARKQATLSRRQNEKMATLNAFSRTLAGLDNLIDLLRASARQLAELLRVRAVFLLPRDGRMTVIAGYPHTESVDSADIAAAQWCWEHGAVAGRGSATLPGARRRFVPLTTGTGAVGVVGLDWDGADVLASPEEISLLESLLDQTAVSIERIQLADDIDEARVAAETERLRAAMLTSVSHDLRTPLASIIGSITSLKRIGQRTDQASRDELMETIQDEAERLNRFVGNLLDMTRLEAGALRPKSQAVELSEMVETALRRAERVLAHHSIVIQVAPDLPMIEVDPVLFEQVLFNLLDNAAKYSAAGSQIKLSADQIGAMIRIAIADEGIGIPPDQLETVFDKFHRAHESDRRPAGTGLGLAVCRGFVEAFGGRIAAANRADRTGAVLTILLPAVSASRLTGMLGAAQ